MVGIVLVSHSRPLALAVQTLVHSLAGADVPLAIAAGAGDNRADLGTDATEILAAIQSVMSDAGVIVLMDMGSAVLSAETALEFLEPAEREKVRLCAAPFVEGAVIAGVTAHTNSAVQDVLTEAMRSLHQKHEHLHPGGADQPSATPAAESTAWPPPSAPTATVKVRNAHGLHARPAVRLVEAAARFDADIQLTNLSHPGPWVSAKSLSSMIALEVLKDHEIRVAATGRQAQEAVSTLRAMIDSGLGEFQQTQPKPAAAAAQDFAVPQAVAEGLVVGQAIWREDEPLVVPQDRTDNTAAEIARLEDALRKTHDSLLRDRDAARASVGPESADIFMAQAMLLDDPVLLRRTQDLITRENANAALAWHTSVCELADHYQALGDEYLRQRAADVRDVGRRVLHELGVESQGSFNGDSNSILIVDDLAPGEVMHIVKQKVAGVICLDGGTTSHSSILLRTYGIPSVVQARTALARILADRRPARIALDGGTGRVWIEPDDRQVQDLLRCRERWMKEREGNLAAAKQPAVTRDGHSVKIFANVAQLSDADAANHHGAEGIGLLRTEFLFMRRDTAPTEEEQVALLDPIVARMHERPVIIRTLDAGGDKEVPYLGLPKEANPFLGVRALRISLRQPELFLTQLRALLRVAHNRDVGIMFPMVSNVSELRAARDFLARAHDDLTRRGVPHAWPISTGIMIEIPSAVFLAEELAIHADFFSVGTNDLVQYLFAADRGNPSLGDLQDALHPAVLRALRHVIDAAHRHSRPVSVCGEAASDIQAAKILLGLGVDELSMNAPAIPKIKAAIRSADFASLQRLAHEALTLPDAHAVRQKL